MPPNSTCPAKAAAVPGALIPQNCLSLVGDDYTLDLEFNPLQPGGLSPNWVLDSIEELIGEIGMTVPCR